MATPTKLALQRAWDFCTRGHPFDDPCDACAALATAFEKFAVVVGGKPHLQRFACALCHAGDATYFRRYGNSQSFRCEGCKDKHPYGAPGVPGVLETRHRCQKCGTAWATQVFHGHQLTAHCDACAPPQKITDEMRRA
jgi:hypothetical protein